MKNKLKTFIVASAAVLIGLVTVEMVARAILPARANVLALNSYQESERGKFARYDAQLGWAGLENASDEFTWVDARHGVRQNSHGFRGSEHPFERSGKHRLLALGDSYTWGFGVEDDEIYTSVMEEMAGKTLETVNTGVSGYGTDQELIFWREKGRLWSPDRVLLMVTFLTDLGDNLHAVRYSYQKPVFRLAANGSLQLTNVPVPKKDGQWGDERSEVEGKKPGTLLRALSKSAFAGLAINAALKNDNAREWLESRGVVPKREPGYEWEYLVYSSKFDEDTKEAWTMLFALMGELKMETALSNARLIVAVVPSVIQVYPELWSEYVGNISRSLGANAATELSPSMPMERIRGWCDESGVEFVDLLTPLKEAGKEDPYLYFPINRHWTPKAHRVVAETLVKRLKLD